MARLFKTHRERKALSNEDLAQERELNALRYRRLFGTPEGQEVLADLLQRCGVMQSSYQGDAPEATAYREGRRRIGLEIIELINREPNAQVQALRHGDTEELFHE